MAIKILSPQLANQIAAGEVVERPASVVKELVENSLDAGASKIQVDIENGGATLIRIRDNGCGIAKDELSLALARHATSKIADLDDLEAILTLGFRGEALASISSVSRLTLTSRTAEQNEGWQVYAQGRDMETVIQPAAHPVGTTVEVANLFFNTPARRKFLRTDKTEFAHIDEVLRRIALAKFNIAFTLTHNGKIIRQYRPATDVNQQLKRIAAICGDDFVRSALRIDWQHDDLHLSGWVATPDFMRSQNDLSYSYINGRMVKDKVITHAIRQAYADIHHSEQYPAFVLFLDLNPNDVDVNVHPTKHEVRFQQARLIHDFIYQGVSHALTANVQPELSPVNQVQEPAMQYGSNQINRASAGQNIFAGSHSFSHSQTTPKWGAYQPSYRTESPSKSEQRIYQNLLSDGAMGESHSLPYKSEKWKGETGQQDLKQDEDTIIPSPQPADISTPTNFFPNSTALNVQVDEEMAGQAKHLRAVGLIAQQALLLQRNQDFYLLSLPKLQRLQFELALNRAENPQPLLIPLVFRLNELQFNQWQKLQPFWAEIGCEFVANAKQQRITLNKIPSILKGQNLQKCVIAMLPNASENPEQWRAAFCQLLDCKPIDTLADAVNLLSACERLTSNPQDLQSLLLPIDWQPFLEQL